MTDVQLQYCKKCLNRKSGVITQDNNCNLKGFNTEFEGVCSSFDLDEKVIVGVGNRINEIRPNDQRARLAQTFIWIVMALNIVSVYSSYLQYDLRVQVLAIVFPIVYLISAVIFLKWFQRAYYNLSRITNCKHTEGWASWSWFIPIISIFWPYQIMKEMNDKTLAFLKTKTTNIIKDHTQLIGLWWGFWVVSNYIGNYILKTAFKEETVENLINSTIAEIIASLIGIPLAIITVKIIKTHALKENMVSEISEKLQ